MFRDHRHVGTQHAVDMVCPAPHRFCYTSNATLKPCPNAHDYYNRKSCACVYVQWALHHLCNGSTGVPDLLPRLDCGLPLDGCYSYLLQGRHASATVCWSALHAHMHQPQYAGQHCMHMHQPQYAGQHCMHTCISHSMLVSIACTHALATVCWSALHAHMH